MSADREINENPTYLALLTVNESISFAVSTIFLILIICSKIIHNKAARIRTITLYIFFYEIAALLVAVDAISDNYDLYEENGSLDLIFDISKTSGFVLSHELFFILMIEKLYYPFKDTMHRIKYYNIFLLLFTSIIIEAYHFFIRIVINYDIDPSIHVSLLVTFMVISLLFGTLLILIFVNKLLSIIYTSRKSLHILGDDFTSNSPHSQFSVLSRMSLNSQQLTLIKVITKNVILSVMAIIFRNIEIICYGIARIEQQKILHAHEEHEHHNHNSVLILYGVLNVSLFLQLSCVYLSFTFLMGSKKIYGRLCGKFHKCVHKAAVRRTQRKLARMNMGMIESYKLLPDDGDGFDISNQEYSRMTDGDGMNMNMSLNRSITAEPSFKGRPAMHMSGNGVFSINGSGGFSTAPELGMRSKHITPLIEEDGDEYEVRLKGNKSSINPYRKREEKLSMKLELIEREDGIQRDLDNVITPYSVLENEEDI